MALSCLPETEPELVEALSGQPKVVRIGFSSKREHASKRAA